MNGFCFEKLAKDYGNVPAQMLLVPVQVNLTAAEKQALLQNLDMLMDAGLEVEDFGGATVVVRAVPADVAVDDVEDMVVELASRLAEGSRDALREKTEWVLHSIACRAAIKAGDRTSNAEMPGTGAKYHGWLRAAVLPAWASLRIEDYPEGAGKTVWTPCVNVRGSWRSAGRQATGKTALSVAMARRFNGEIINADSMQIYRELSVGTAKVMPEEQQGVPHHLLDFLPPECTYSVADFYSIGIERYFGDHGAGTSALCGRRYRLYITSLLNGVSFAPEKNDPQVRRKLQQEAARARSEVLYSV